MNTTLTQNRPTESAVASITPRYEVETKPEGLTVRVELPGVSKALTTLSLDNDILSVKGTRSNTRPESWKPVHRELSDMDFSLRLRLNGPLDNQRLSAQMEDGVLLITIPVRESAKPRLISVN